MHLTREQTGGYARAGFGPPVRPHFWIGNDRNHGGCMQVAFAANSRAEVEAFHAAALTAGGRDNGAPRLCPHYHAHYYGAFALDPDEHNFEAVCHAAEL